ncbi:MAG: M67 family metallopeptidase [Oscillochloris sp.]|nr:M67 family metallopeptidase [Oscillochloris sp.]
MLCLSSEVAGAIASHAEADYPEECVGLLLGCLDGTVRTALRALALENRAGSPRDRFYLDPHDYLAADSVARAAGLEIVGCYHSHPDAPAAPSVRDRLGAPGGGQSFAFVIQSVRRGRAAELASWLLLDPDVGFVAENVCEIPIPEGDTALSR